MDQDLLKAVIDSNVQKVSILLSQGANPNYHYSIGNTEYSILSEAIKQNRSDLMIVQNYPYKNRLTTLSSYKIIEKLLNAGADPNFGYVSPYECNFPLYMLFQHVHFKIWATLKLFTDLPNLDYNQRYHNITILEHLISRNVKTEIACLFLEKGANPNQLFFFEIDKYNKYLPHLLAYGLHEEKITLKTIIVEEREKVERMTERLEELLEVEAERINGILRIAGIQEAVEAAAEIALIQRDPEISKLRINLADKRNIIIGYQKRLNIIKESRLFLKDQVNKIKKKWKERKRNQYRKTIYQVMTRTNHHLPIFASPIDDIINFAQEK